MYLRCPACGGLNPPDAQWCGQCLTRFVTAASPPPPPPPPPPGIPGAPAAPPTTADGPDPSTAPVHDVLEAWRSAQPRNVVSQKGAFKATNEGIVWTCTRCDTENPIDEPECSVCGTLLSELMLPQGPERPARDPGTAAMLSLFLPGAGHAYIGEWGQGIARAIMQAFVVLVAVLTAIQAGVNWVVLIFGAAALALWMVAAHDAYREASGEPRSALLYGRRFMWVVMGLLMLLMLAVVLSAFQAGVAPPIGPGTEL